MIASDGILDKGKGHPRAAGTYARVLGRYVREQHVISLMDALRKMTVQPADRLGMQDEGPASRWAPTPTSLCSTRPA